ncbi:MAG: ROK family protein [Saprospiraceae bacterium]|nr:ROK family protein [Saprospiraceae bacterium]
MDVVLGIDIGGTSSKLGLVQADGSIIAKRSVDTRKCRNEESFFSCLFAEIERFLEQHHSNYHCIGIGLGAPSCDEQAGVLEKAANFPFADRVPILQFFQDHFGLPVYLTKDGNAATLGEARYGAGQYLENFVLITLGTGIGGGLFLNGQLVKGHNGWAGEFGHITVEPGGRACGCGRRGCLETYASATGLRRTVLQRLTHGDQKSILRRLAASELEAKDVYLAAKMGDALSLEVFDDVGRRLGLALANLAAIFDPQAIFLAGGLAAAEDILLTPVRKYFETFVLPQLQGRISIETSALRLNEAAIAGAASLVWHHKNLITTHDECK